MTTKITYEEVRNNANTIQECSRVMSNIFESFNSSMKRVGADDVFVGNASESLGARFNSLKTKFDAYTNLVNDFSTMILSAVSATEQTEQKLASAASDLKG